MLSLLHQTIARWVEVGHSVGIERFSGKGSPTPGQDIVFGGSAQHDPEIPCVSVLLPHCKGLRSGKDNVGHILNRWQRAPGSRPGPRRYVLEEHWRFFVGSSALPRDSKTARFASLSSVETRSRIKLANEGLIVHNISCRQTGRSLKAQNLQLAPQGSRSATSAIELGASR